tara:strand:- start:1135 stop:1386 length:252 start_codon:yes stop_codon:yes gene_type:complete
MGVINKILGRVDLKHKRHKEGSDFFNIELNKGRGGLPIHIQNESFRIEMTVPEFTQFATSIINGANKMLEYKDINPIKKDLEL